jgi:hypothetical protein
MSGQHEERGVRANQVSVGELIARITREGMPCRLADWPERVVPESTPPDDWPTGELPCLAGIVALGRSGGAASGGSIPTSGYQEFLGNPNVDDDVEELWGNRGPRPFQNFVGRSC